MLNQKQNLIPGGVTVIQATLKGLKDAGMVISITSPLTHMFSLCRSYTQNKKKIFLKKRKKKKLPGSWRMAMDYCKLNQVVTPIVADIPHFFHEQINRAPGTWYAATVLSKSFFRANL